jgi:hypothetical protein
MAERPMIGRWISTRDAHRIENKIRQRKVIGWALRAAHWKNGHRLPGSVLINLEGGGYIYHPEGTKLDDALDQAEDHGFSVTEAREQLTRWVATGEGATFTLEVD